MQNSILKKDAKFNLKKIFKIQFVKKNVILTVSCVVLQVLI